MTSTGRMTASERREQLLATARTGFVRDGYRASTTAAVAAAAGVSETLVLKHFGSKEGLFRAAVVDPLLTLLEDQVTENKMRAKSGEDLPVGDVAAAVRSFLEAWARLIRDERGAVLSLLTDSREFPDVARRVGELLRAHVDDMADTIGDSASGRDYRPFDARTATYAALAAATLAGLVDDTDIDAFLTELVDLILYGVLAR